MNKHIGSTFSLEEQHEKLAVECERLVGENASLRAENEKLAEALRFYSNEQSWEPKFVRHPSSWTRQGTVETIETEVLMDRGKKARAALGEKE